MELQELSNRMEVLNVDNSHNKDKLQIIETTMKLLQENINKDAIRPLIAPNIAPNTPSAPTLKNFTCCNNDGWIVFS